MSRRLKFEVGQRLWRYDVNKRVYRPKEEGRLWSSGGPIYEQSFWEHKVLGVEGRSYVIGRGPDSKMGDYGNEKVGFSAAEQKYKTDGEKDGLVWMHDHRYRLTQRIEKCEDLDVLKQIAALVGYEHERMIDGTH